jgi:hypothetical protein
VGLVATGVPLARADEHRDCDKRIHQAEEKLRKEVESTASIARKPSGAGTNWKRFGEVAGGKRSASSGADQSILPPPASSIIPSRCAKPWSAVAAATAFRAALIRQLRLSSIRQLEGKPRGRSAGRLVRGHLYVYGMRATPEAMSTV